MRQVLDSHDLAQKLYAKKKHAHNLYPAKSVKDFNKYR